MIKIVLANGYYYKGTIIKEDDEYFFLVDINGTPVKIKKDAVVVQEELS